jgi:hypothetical protein
MTKHGEQDEAAAPVLLEWPARGNDSSVYSDDWQPGKDRTAFGLTW